MKIDNIRCLAMAGLVSAAMLAGCEKTKTTEYYAPSGPVTVSIDKTEADANVPFQLTFTGLADSLIFYSGEEGHQYEFRNRTEMVGVTHQLSFLSYRQWGTQNNTLALLVSRDFNGEDYSEEAIKAATWVDITNRAVLSTGADNTPSGTIDVTDLLGKSGSVYFAFKFVGAAGSTQRTWTIKDFNINTVMPDGTVEEVANTETAGWVETSMKNPEMRWSISPTRIQMVGGNATAGENEDWIISKGFPLYSFGPDHGEVIKSRYQFMLKDHWFVYSEPGDYHAVLVVKNGSGDGQVETTHEFDLKVR